MGCGSSKPATKEEEQEICKVMGKDMCYLCLRVALEHTDKIDVEVPTTMHKIRDAFKEKVEEMKAERAAEGGAEEGNEAEAPAEAAKEGGLVGKAMGLLNWGADKATEAITKACDMSADVLVKALEEGVKAMDAAIEKVTQPLKSVGQDIFAQNKDKIIAAMKEHIDKMDFPEARAKTVTGGPTECTTFAWKDQSEIVKVLRGAEGVEEAIKKQKAVAAWDTFINQYKQLCEQFKGTVELPAADLDMPTYICESTVATIGKMMNKEEEAFRANPNRNDVRKEVEPEFPEIFEKVFTMEKQNAEIRKDEKKKGQELFLSQPDYNCIISKRNKKK